MPTVIDKLIWAWRDFIYSLLKKIDCLFQCELCRRTLHDDRISDYYRDVLACTICCPEGYEEPDAHDMDEDY